MSTVEEAEKLLSRMTRGEKAQLLQRVVRDLGDAFPGVDTIGGVCGGEPCIVRTRIPVWVLEQARRLGARKLVWCATHSSEVGSAPISSRNNGASAK